MSTGTIYGAAYRQRNNLRDAERALWWLLSQRKTGYDFRCKYVLEPAHAIVDFYCPDLGVAFEVESAYHRNPDHVSKLSARSAKITGQGTKLIWVPDYEILKDSQAALSRAFGALGINLPLTFEATVEEAVQTARNRREEEKQARIAKADAEIERAPKRKPRGDRVRNVALKSFKNRQAAKSW